MNSTLFSDDDWIFQNDNAPCHRAKKVQHWYGTHNIGMVPGGVLAGTEDNLGFII